MKKIICLILCLSMMFGLSSSAFADTIDCDNEEIEYLTVDGVSYMYSYVYTDAWRSIKVVNTTSGKTDTVFLDIEKGELLINNILQSNAIDNGSSAEKNLPKALRGYSLLSSGSSSFSWAKNTVLAVFFAIVAAYAGCKANIIAAGLGSVGSLLAASGGSATVYMNIYWTGAGSNPMIYWFNWLLDVSGDSTQYGWYNYYDVVTP